MNGSISALELELEEDAELGVDEELDDAELELYGAELEADDAELEEDSEWEAADDGESDYELGDDGELVEPDRHGFAERFYELSLREGESELELAREVDTLLREMEHEYFFKGLLKKVKGAGKSLLKHAAKAAGGALPIGNLAKIATSLARGDMRGMLGSLANTALSVASKHPALAAAMPALNLRALRTKAVGQG
jgi:hypothetical protein